MGVHDLINRGRNIQSARRLYATGRFSQRDLANKFGVCQHTIRRWIDANYWRQDNERKMLDERQRRQDPKQRMLLRKKGRMRHTPDPRNRTYVVRHKDLVKIGTAVDVPHRFVSLQGSSPVPLRLLGILPFPELEVHDLFDQCRRHGEWFQLTRKLRSFLKEHLVSL